MIKSSGILNPVNKMTNQKTSGDARHDGETWLGKFPCILLFSLPLVLFLYLYLPAVDYGFVWLDHMEIQNGGGILPPGDWLSAFTRPVHVGSGSSSGSNPFYRPLQLLVTNAVYRYIGADPYGFHLVALIFGSLTIVGFTFFSWLLFKRPLPTLIAGLVAAAHPAGIEPTVWISSTSETMSTLFILVSLIFAKLFLDSTGDDRKPLMLISWLALVTAMLTKEKAVMTPVLLLFMVIGDYLAHATDAHNPSECADSVIHRRATTLIRAQLLAAVVFFFILRPLVVGGLVGKPIRGSLLTHWLSALASWPDTLFSFVVPLQSTASDVVDVVSSFSDLRVWLGVGILLGSLAVWLLLLRAGYTVAAFGLAWIWIAYLPTANLMPMLHAHAERYMYLSVFGFALLIAGLVQGLHLQVAKRAFFYRHIVTVLVLAIVFGLAERTQYRLPDWASTESLFSRDVERDPDYREGMYYLALSKFDQGHYAQAERHLNTLISLVEEFPGKASYINRADVYELACINALASRHPGKAILLVERGMQTIPEIRQDADVLKCLKMARDARALRSKK